MHAYGRIKTSAVDDHLYVAGKVPSALIEEEAV
jgi:hypothetical protein